jgi:flagellar biosynthesis/type III secretory pathway M-ring protein FliF/YscJ
MKGKDLHIRLSEKRREKLKEYAALKERTIASLIEEWIDALPTPDKTTNTRG